MHFGHQSNYHSTRDPKPLQLLPRRSCHNGFTATVSFAASQPSFGRPQIPCKMLMAEQTVYTGSRPSYAPGRVIYTPLSQKSSFKENPDRQGLLP